MEREALDCKISDTSTRIANESKSLDDMRRQLELAKTATDKGDWYEMAAIDNSPGHARFQDWVRNTSDHLLAHYQASDWRCKVPGCTAKEFLDWKRLKKDCCNPSRTVVVLKIFIRGVVSRCMVDVRHVIGSLLCEYVSFKK